MGVLSLMSSEIAETGRNPNLQHVQSLHTCIGAAAKHSWTKPLVWSKTRSPQRHKAAQA